MSNPMRSATLTDQFVGDGFYNLRLGIDELIQLQEKTGVGPNIIATRLLEGAWLVDDIRETIRLSLIGGGASHRAAFDLVTNYVKEGYLMDYTSLAANTLYAALTGIEDEPLPGEAEAPTMENQTPSED
jgi:hypothetical protein